MLNALLNIYGIGLALYVLGIWAKRLCGSYIWGDDFICAFIWPLLVVRWFYRLQSKQ